MMSFRSFPANKGDSFLLSWGDAGTPHYLLIDAGIPGTYRFIRPEIKKIASLDAIILTHVDYDHIGGLLKLIEDEDLELRGYTVYMNSPGLALAPDADGRVGIGHGVQLDALLKRKGIRTLPLFTDIHVSKLVSLNGLSLELLSPTMQILERLLQTWKAEEVFRQHMANNANDGKVSRPGREKLSFGSILQAGESIPPWENDLINASSIAFTASYEDICLLFLGDANPEIVFDQLIRMGYSAENRLRVDLCKLSHHGSQTSTSKNLLSVIHSSAFYISTDGSGPNYHPDRETIVRIAAFGRKDPSEHLYFFTNYPLNLEHIITAEECNTWNLSFEHREEISYKK
jgi:ribonuclease BN (tRNA processing enzyme)